MSVASRNPEGLSESEIKKWYQQETIPGPNYKPRRRRELSLKEQEQIVNEFLKKVLATERDSQTAQSIR